MEGDFGRYQLSGIECLLIFHRSEDALPHKRKGTLFTAYYMQASNKYDLI